MRSSKEDQHRMMEDAPAAASQPASHSGPRQMPQMRIFMLRPHDPQEPPFHFSSTPSRMIVAAGDEREARRVASAHPGGEVWLNPEITTCAPLSADHPMVVMVDTVR